LAEFERRAVKTAKVVLICVWITETRQDKKDASQICSIENIQAWLNRNEDKPLQACCRVLAEETILIPAPEPDLYYLNAFYSCFGGINLTSRI
jgi:hypothetical protein